MQLAGEQWDAVGARMVAKPMADEAHLSAAAALQHPVIKLLPLFNGILKGSVGLGKGWGGIDCRGVYVSTRIESLEGRPGSSQDAAVELSRQKHRGASQTSLLGIPGAEVHQKVVTLQAEATCSAAAMRDQGLNLLAGRFGNRVLQAGPERAPPQSRVAAPLPIP